jgi:hypothetical protein
MKWLVCLPLLKRWQLKMLSCFSVAKSGELGSANFNNKCAFYSVNSCSLLMNSKNLIEVVLIINGTYEIAEGQCQL